MRILVTGGAGYIGSHMTRMLVARGHQAVVLDSMEHGHKESLPPEATLIVGNVADTETLHKAFSGGTIDGVLHFAGFISVEESVREPKKYFQNNLVAPISLLDAMVEANLKYIIFSSTSAVYGNPKTIPIPEDHPKEPRSPYGLSKLCFEDVLALYDRNSAIRSISLRYFNASGASMDGAFGESHVPEPHIIPNAVMAAQGKIPEFTLFGTDYQTPDGTCIRDYIHVEDLCEAHMLALEALLGGHTTGAYNVGTGEGISNREIIAAVKKISGADFPVRDMPKRAGDSDRLVADSTNLQKEFGWKPKYSDIDTIVSSAWKWHTSHPNGYGH